MAAVPRNGIVYCEDGEDDDVTTILCARARIRMDKLNDSKRPRPDIHDISLNTGTRVLLRRVYFLNEEKSRYVSVGFYPSENYRVLAEFSGPRIVPITLTEQHVKTLMEHLPALCEAMHRGELYTCKDGPFRLRSCKTHNNARMYRDRKCISFKLTDLRYMMNILPMVQAQQAQYILAQTDVTAFAVAALGSIEFIEPPHTTAGLIPYGQLFNELKVQLI